MSNRHIMKIRVAVIMRDRLRIISKKKIRDYSKDNTQAELPLAEWYITMRACNAKNLNALKIKFNSVDSVHGYTVFNIGGNNYRLITAIHYNTQYCYIRTIWTHAEYSKSYNQAKLKRGML
jgi:mRNA interferase HigB